MDVQPIWSADSDPYSFWYWQVAAACRTVDSSLFFAADGERDSERRVRERRAKAVCAVCRVKLPCRAYAIDHHERYGIWGGLTERDRARLWAAAAAIATADRSGSGRG